MNHRVQHLGHFLLVQDLILRYLGSSPSYSSASSDWSSWRASSMKLISSACGSSSTEFAPVVNLEVWPPRFSLSTPTSFAMSFISRFLAHSRTPVGKIDPRVNDNKFLISASPKPSAWMRRKPKYLSGGMTWCSFTFLKASSHRLQKPLRDSSFPLFIWQLTLESQRSPAGSWLPRARFLPARCSAKLHPWPGAWRPGMELCGLGFALVVANQSRHLMSQSWKDDSHHPTQEVVHSARLPVIITIIISPTCSSASRWPSRYRANLSTTTSTFSTLAEERSVHQLLLHQELVDHHLSCRATTAREPLLVTPKGWSFCSATTATRKYSKYAVAAANSAFSRHYSPSSRALSGHFPHCTQQLIEIECDVNPCGSTIHRYIHIYIYTHTHEFVVQILCGVACSWALSTSPQLLLVRSQLPSQARQRVTRRITYNWNLTMYALRENG